MKKKILYVDMDGVLVDFESGLEQCSQEILEKYAGYRDEIPGLFAKMKPMEGAIESFKELSQLFDTYILSTAPWKNPTAPTDKLNWVKKYLGDVAHKRLILSHHKNLNQGDFLIDDRLKNGAGQFEGEHIHFGVDKRFLDWKSVVQYLKENR